MDNVYRVTIPDEYGGGWVDIRDRIGWAQEAYIEAQGVKPSEPDEEGNRHIMPDYFEMGMAKLKTYILAWSLTDEAGAPIPITREGFGSPDLPGDLGGWIIREAEAHYAERRRTKRGVGRTQPDDGRADSGEQGAG